MFECESVYELLEVFVLAARGFELCLGVLELALQGGDASARHSEHALGGGDHLLQSLAGGALLRQLLE